jgi:acyl dehydratase
MDELEEMIGESVVTVTDFEIEEGKLEEFARAIKDDNPTFRSEEAAKERGHAQIPAPLTFTRVSAFPRYLAEGIDSRKRGFDLGFDRNYSLHGEQTYEYERPVYVGDVLTGVTTLVDVYQREGERGGLMTIAVKETEYRDQDDELVLTEQSTVIETEEVVDETEGNDD